MKREKYFLYEKEEYNYSKSGFIPSIEAYVHDDGKMHPAILICPGGGYLYVSPAEAEIVALEYFNKNYNAFVLVYSTKTFMSPNLGMQALKDASRAICEIRKSAHKHSTIVENVSIIGFSAGGHLAGSLAVHYNYPGIKAKKDAGIDNRPNAVILCYPVISGLKFAHSASFQSLLGQTPKAEDVFLLSLEEHVNKATPPVFLWHTVSDDVVSYENSVVFMQACAKHNVPCEMHIYPYGIHGLSVASKDFLNLNFGNSNYVFEQLYCDIKYCANNSPNLLPKEALDAADGNVEYLKSISLATVAQHNINGMKARKGNISDDIIMPDKTVRNWVNLSQDFLLKFYR